VIPETTVVDRTQTRRAWLLAAIPLALLALLLLVLTRSGPLGLVQPEGMPPVERLVIERAQLDANGIHLSVLNDGPDPVTIAQVVVDDAYWAFTAEGDRLQLGHLGRTRLHIPYPWVAGEAHLVKLLTSTGTPFEHEIAVAVETPKVEGRQIAAFALIGLYVGVIPVALGLMWFPLVKRLGPVGLDVLLALTLGLLLFLLIDTTHEGIETSSMLPGSYQGIALFAAAVLGAYLVLEWFGSWLAARRARQSRTTNGAVLALLVATGIGLHNFGEGLAIGAAFALGEAALGTLLVIGFTLHNTTEGLAIVAPLARERPSLRQLAWLGFIGGAPTVVGAWAGGLIYSPVLAVVFLGLGAGAIAQVFLQIARQMAGSQSIGARFSSLPVLSGLAAGFLIMLVTGMLVG
jgi:zinc transporter, ZIP family